MQPYFSIITPSFNALKGLLRSFDSVAAQAPGLFEYLIVDGASTDGTTDWLRQQKPDWCSWISEHDSGVYCAMNKGIGMAKGRFLLFLGAGDLLREGVLGEAAQWIERLPKDGPHFIYGDVLMMDQDARRHGGPFTNLRFCWENISHQAIFYEKSIFDLLGPYDLKYPVYSDWAFNIRCFGDRRITKCHWSQVISDFERGGLSDRVRDMPFAADHLELIQKHLGWFPALFFRMRKKVNRVRYSLQQSSKSS